jgi:hypothetical protein
MTKTSVNLYLELDEALKLRLIEETKKAKLKDKKAPVLTIQKFIVSLLEKELKIKKNNTEC